MTLELDLPDSPPSTERLYQLGSIVFSLKNCDAQFKDNLDLLLPHYGGPDAVQKYHIDTGCTKNVLDLVHHVAKLHHKSIWIQASCLSSATGKKVLLAGKMGSGKSLTALALREIKGFKVLSENLVFVDCEKKKLVSFSAPFAVDEKAILILEPLVNQLPEPRLIVEWRKDRVWIPVDSSGIETYEDADFALAVWLSDVDDLKQLTLGECTLTEFVRSIMTVSNALRMPGSTDLLYESLASAKIVTISGGSLRDRANAIYDLAG